MMNRNSLNNLSIWKVVITKKIDVFIEAYDVRFVLENEFKFSNTAVFQ